MSGVLRSRVGSSALGALVVLVALGLAGCRPTGPFDVDLLLLPASFPPEVTCPGIDRTLSGFDCAESDGSCMLGRTVESLSIHLEVIEVPEAALGERVPEILSGFCRPGAPCPVRRVGEPIRLPCGTSVGACLVRELGSLEAMLASGMAPTEIDVRGAAIFRLVVADTTSACRREDLDCIVGCAYSLPLLVGSGPVEATLALDASGGCGLSALRVCAGFAGTP